MRAYEFITESANPLDTQSGMKLGERPLPHTYIIPDLTNQDFYQLYRFGLAIAAVRGEDGQDDGVQNGHKQKFKAESEWGEHQIVSSFDPEIDKVIDKALGKINKKGKKLVSTPTSQETTDTILTSPLKPFKGYKK